MFFFAYFLAAGRGRNSCFLIYRASNKANKATISFTRLALINYNSRKITRMAVKWMIGSNKTGKKRAGKRGNSWVWFWDWLWAGKWSCRRSWSWAGKWSCRRSWAWAGKWSCRQSWAWGLCLCLLMTSSLTSCGLKRDGT